MKKKLLIYLLLLIATVLMLFVYFFVSGKIKKLIDKQIISYVSTKTKREITYSSFKYSFNKIDIDDICVYEPQSKEKFGCAKKILIKFDIFPLLHKSDIIFDEIKIENGFVNFIKSKDKWNFIDIYKLIPYDSRPLYQRLNIRSIDIKKIDILIKDIDTNNEFLFKNTQLEINHPLKTPDFNIETSFENYFYISKTKIYSIFNSEFNINFSEKLNKLQINNLNITNLNMENYKIENISLDFYLDKIKKEATTTLNIKNFGDINNIGLYNKIANEYKKIYSKDLDIGKTINFDLDLKIKDKSIYLKLNSNLFKIKSTIDLVANKHIFEFSSGKTHIKSNNIINVPKIESNLSESINNIAKEIIMKYEKYVELEYTMIMEEEL